MSGASHRSPSVGDLDSRSEIAEMVRRFYQDVAQDDLLGPMFNDIAQVNWAEHLDKLTLFWCRALLGIEGYRGNPFRAHSLINDRAPFTLAHFDRWLQLFEDTLELGWVGPNTERARALAYNVARVHSGQLVGTDYEPHPGGAAPSVGLSMGNALGRPGLDPSEMGGESPCLAELVEDHRDHRPVTS